jgi:hypothetical protein
MVNILQLTVAYLNATINVKPETQNWRLEPTGLAKPGETHRVMGTGPGLACQESAGRVFGRFWNRTDLFFWSKPGPLAGYLDPLLTLPIIHLSLKLSVKLHKAGEPLTHSAILFLPFFISTHFNCIDGHQHLFSLSL